MNIVKNKTLCRLKLWMSQVILVHTMNEKVLMNKGIKKKPFDFCVEEWEHFLKIICYKQYYCVFKHGLFIKNKKLLAETLQNYIRTKILKQNISNIFFRVVLYDNKKDVSLGYSNIKIIIFPKDT